MHDWVGIGYVKRRQRVVGRGAAGQVLPERKGLQGGAEPWKRPPPAPVSSPFFSTKLLRFRIPQLEAHMRVCARVPYSVPSTPVSTCPPTPWPSWDSCRVSGPPSPSLGLSYPTSSISHLPCPDLGQRRSLEWPPPGTQHPGQGLQPSWAPPLPFSQVSWPRSHPWGPSQVSVPWGPAGCRAGMREPVHSLGPLC